MSEYVRNLWYVAAWVGEVPDGGVLARTLLDVPYIIYRLGDGSYAMLHDRCPHRFVPLSKGRREGDRIVCGYHGLQFDGAGRCVHTEFRGDPPASAKVATLPIVERHGALWFWPGDAEAADPATIPDFSFLQGPQPMARSHLTMRGNYELVTDNLMDLSHAEFIHIESFGVNGSLFGGEHSVIQDDDGAIWNNWDMTGCEPPEWSKPMLDPGAKVDMWLHMRWHAPASMALSVGVAKAGTDRQEMIVPQLLNPHIITPETKNSSHYFYDHEPTEAAAEMARKVFVEEDEPMIEAAHDALAGTDFWDARPVILPSDAGAIRARRRLMQLRSREREGQAVSA